jgi:hypothetical protein
MHVWFIVYLAFIIGHFTDWFAWWYAAQRLLLFQFAIICGPYILFQYITFDVTFLQKVLKAGTGKTLHTRYMYVYFLH